jgi:hypothetical protein
MQNIIQYPLLKVRSIYIYKTIVDQQCGFRRNRSTTDQNFCIRQILEKKWEHSDTVHRLFVDLKKAYDSVRREVLYNNPAEFGTPIELLRLIKKCFYNCWAFNNSVSVMSISFLLHRAVCDVYLLPFLFDSLQLSFLAQMTFFHRTGTISWSYFICSYLQLQYVLHSSCNCRENLPP